MTDPSVGETTGSGAGGSKANVVIHEIAWASSGRPLVAASGL
jgi:hypothetical protein